MEMPDSQRVAAIVPVYNEAETLAEVIRALRASELVDEVLVISDGSTDGTLDIIRETGVRAIHLTTNAGKGVAMATGVAHTTAPIIVFIDGDILHLTEALLRQLILPVTEGESDMNIGVRDRGALVNMVHRRTGPLLSGLRCLRRDIFAAVPDHFLQGYRIETALNWACRRLRRVCTTTVLHNLEHLVKERKRGLVMGLLGRCYMFGAVFAAYLQLRFTPPRLEAGPRPGPAQLELEYINF
jgi:glycosyltransferase involved in cell wall biosynthesis